MKRMIVGILLSITAVSVLSMYFFKEKLDNKAAMVDVQIVEKSDIVSSVYFRGNIMHEETYDIYLTSPVEVSEVYYKEGDLINEGDSIFSYTKRSENDYYSYSNNIVEVFEPLFNSNPTKKLYLNSNALNGIVESPISGIITKLNIESGLNIPVFNSCLTVSSSDKMCVYAKVPEEYIQDIEIGMSCEITGNAFREKSYKGQVKSIDPYASTPISLTGKEETSVNVQISIEDPDELLHEGYSARAEIFTSKRSGVITVDYGAVCQDINNNEYVFVFTNGIAEKRYIITGTELQDEVEIIEGLKEGDMVILNPDGIHDGNRVKYEDIYENQ